MNLHVASNTTFLFQRNPWQTEIQDGVIHNLEDIFTETLHLIGASQHNYQKHG